MTRVVLLTIAGPGGHVDVGVRADVTTTELARLLGSLIGLRADAAVAEHRSPPRPGVPRGRRAALEPGILLGEAGVVDGDLIFFQDIARERNHVSGRSGSP